MRSNVLVKEAELVLVEIWKFGPGTLTVMLLERFAPVAVKKLVPMLGVPWVATSPFKAEGETIMAGPPAVLTIKSPRI